MRHLNDDILCRYGVIEGDLDAYDRTLLVVDPPVSVADSTLSEAVLERRRTLSALADSTACYSALTVKCDGVAEEHWRLYYEPTADGVRRGAYVVSRLCESWGARSPAVEDFSRLRTALADLGCFDDRADWHALRSPWRAGRLARAGAVAGAVAALVPPDVPVHVLRTVFNNEGYGAGRLSRCSVVVAAAGSSPSVRAEVLRAPDRRIREFGCSLAIPRSPLRDRAVRSLRSLLPALLAPRAHAGLLAAPHRAIE